MKISGWISVLAIVFLSGCTTTLPKKVAVPANARIGVMLLVDAKPKHVHVGTTVFNNFERDDVSNWGSHEEWYQYTHDLLTRNAAFSVKRIEPTEPLLRSRLQFITAGWNSYSLNQDLIPEFTKIAKSEHIDFLVAIRPFRHQLEVNSTVYADGYGIYTRCAFGSCKAMVLNHVGAGVYAMQPPQDVSWGLASQYDYPLNLNYSGDMKYLPAQEIDKAKSPLSNHMKEKIKSALEKAGLIRQQATQKK